MMKHLTAEMKGFWLWRLQIIIYFKKHSPLFSVEVTGQDVPQPDDDAMAAVKTSIVDSVFPA